MNTEHMMEHFYILVLYLLTYVLTFVNSGGASGQKTASFSKVCLSAKPPDYRAASFLRLNSCSALHDIKLFLF